MQAQPATLAHAIDALDRDDRGLTFVEGDRRRSLSFADLRDAATDVARGLRAAGLRRGDRLVIVLPGQLDFVRVFLGAVRAGIVPVPLYPPLGLAQVDAFRAGLERVARLTDAAAVVSIDALRDVAGPVAGRAGFLTPADCRGAGTADALGFPRPADAVFLQFTSGSTADPKGVVVTNRSLLANAHGIAAHLRADPDRDRAVSWLPMYHDMGLIGFVLVPVLEQLPVWYLPPTEFGRRPQSWCELLDEVRGTISVAPSFAYSLLARRATTEEAARWDLSPWRVAGCGAEPVDAGGLRSFARRLAPARFDPRALLPCYGMAEATLAIALAPLGGGVRTVHHGEREAVSCGRVLPGHAIEVVDAAGASLPEGREGELVFRGPSVAAGYFRDPDATSDTFRHDALHTGDTGLVVDGEVYVTGRKTDVIIVRGRNYHPQDIELSAAAVPGVRRGGVVAFARPGRDGAELVLAVDGANCADATAMREAVRARVHTDFGLVVADTIVVEKGAIAKTSSGKLRRSATRARYLDGYLQRGST
jgi:fatty-acyl-CoA synthase